MEERLVSLNIACQLCICCDVFRSSRKTHISGQKPCGRQLNTKVCGSTKLMLITAHSFPATQRLHSFKFTLVKKSHSQHSVVAVRCEGHHFVRMCTCSLVPRSNTSIIGLGMRLVHKRNCELTTCTAGTGLFP